MHHEQKRGFVEDEYRPNSCIIRSAWLCSFSLCNNRLVSSGAFAFGPIVLCSLFETRAIDGILAFETYNELTHKRAIGKKQRTITHHFLPRVLNNNTAAAPAITVVIPKPRRPSIPHSLHGIPLCCTIESSCWCKSWACWFRGSSFNRRSQNNRD